MNEWKEEILSRCPEKFEQLNKNSYIYRKNIEKKEDEDGNVYYTCLSSVITKDEYNNLVNTDFNNKFLILMEAIADIYEKMEV